MELLHKELSYRIVGEAMHIHREIGPGLKEEFYHTALCERLLASGLPCESKPKRCLVHKGITADEFQADLIVDGCVVLELKCLERGFAAAHYTQLICYLKCWRLALGGLFDFGKESLVHKRVVYTEQPIALNPSSPQSTHPKAPRDRELVAAILASVKHIAEHYGAGYRDTTYRGIFRADLAANGMMAEALEAEVWCDGHNLGMARPACMVLEGRCAVMILALYDRLHAAHRARLQTCLKHLALPWGVLVNFGKKTLDWQYVVHPRSPGPMASRPS